VLAPAYLQWATKKAFNAAQKNINKLQRNAAQRTHVAWLRRRLQKLREVS
jgi:ribosome-interacting GTPase 1